MDSVEIYSHPLSSCRQQSRNLRRESSPRETCADRITFVKIGFSYLSTSFLLSFLLSFWPSGPLTENDSVESKFNRSRRLGPCTRCADLVDHIMQKFPSSEPPSRAHAPHSPHSYGTKYPSLAANRCRLVVRESRSGFILHRPKYISTASVVLRKHVPREWGNR